jgi:hypothetical protein
MVANPKWQMFSSRLVSFLRVCNVAQQSIHLADISVSLFLKMSPLRTLLYALFDARPVRVPK